MKNILFRVDSSSTIGIGHLMRDLVLAKQFLGDHITFASQNLKGNINEQILKHDYFLEIIISNDKYELVELIKRLKIELLIIDHYQIDYETEKYINLFKKISIQITPPDIAYHVLHKDGYLIPVEISTSIMELEGKKIIQGTIMMKMSTA